MARSPDDDADIHGRRRKLAVELARSAQRQCASNPDMDATPRTHVDIPDVEGAPKGLLGVKAPAGYRQTGDIQDRMNAAGITAKKLGL